MFFPSKVTAESRNSIFRLGEEIGEWPPLNTAGNLCAARPCGSGVGRMGGTL